MLYTDELDYTLPPELIARHPVYPRDHSRLLVYRRGSDAIDHCLFSDLPHLLSPGDLLIANDTRVLPAKLSLTKQSGGRITGLFIAEISAGIWRVLLRTRGRAAAGMRLTARSEKRADVLCLKLLEREAEKGQWIVEVNDSRPAPEVLAIFGDVPLPPYIEKARELKQQSAAGGHPGESAVPPPRGATIENIADAQNSGRQDACTTSNADGDNSSDAQNYQTIYASAAGALAAPTAGLHFTPEVFVNLQQRNIQRAFITLHVGLGTFLPVKAASLDQHPMHQETFMIPRTTVEKIREQKARSGRVVLVGTTTVRTLETMAGVILDTSRPPEDFAGSTSLLINPGFTFQLTDALITNFHLPRSTLLALVGALTGMDRLKEIYQQAIARRYRFYSYGDAMLILP